MKTLIVFSFCLMNLIESSHRSEVENVWLCFSPVLCNEDKGSLQDWLEKQIFSARTDTLFELTNKNVKNRKIVFTDLKKSLKGSKFDRTKPTKVIIHGYLNDIQSDVNKIISDAYIKNHDVNVIKVGWRSETPCYNYAKIRLRAVAKVVAELLDNVIENDVSKWKQLTIVGHSLGAHMAGLVGRNVKNGRVGTIVALDPAAPLFSIKDVRSRLTEKDAEYVEVIHTNGECYGMKTAIGTADFYLNGGDTQPGCLVDSCSHSRGIEIFAESLGKNNKFDASKCQKGGNNSSVKLGGEPGNRNKKVSGRFCLKTSNSKPFGVGRSKSKKHTDLLTDVWNGIFDWL